MKVVTLRKRKFSYELVYPNFISFEVNTTTPAETVAITKFSLTIFSSLYPREYIESLVKVTKFPSK